MGQGRNVTVESHNGIYLIREQQVECLFTDNSSVNSFVVRRGDFKFASFD